MPVLIVIWSYLIGSIPSAYIAGRLLARRDIRGIGDGNSGMQNAFRSIGKIAGILVGVSDIGKGSLVIVLAGLATDSTVVIMMAGVAAVLGHNWPFFLNFRGGRGAAVVYGVLLAMLPIPMLVIVVPAGLTMLVTHRVIPTLLAIFAPLPLLAWWMGYSGAEISYSIVLPFLPGVTHLLRVVRHHPGISPQPQIKGRL